MKRIAALAGLAMVIGIGCVACSSEPQATEGDAESVKQVEKNENPAAKSQREAAGTTSAKGATMDPPPGN